MLVTYKNKFITYFFLGIILVILGVSLIWTAAENFLDFYPWSSPIIFLGIVVAFIGNFFYILSHYLLAKAKGYSGWLALLAFINTIGILILFILPDNRKNETKKSIKVNGNK